MPGRRKPQWDTELGRLLYLDGKTDEQIAEELGTSKTAVTNYRIRHWGKANDRPESALEEPLDIPVVSEKNSQPENRRRNPSRSILLAWRHLMVFIASWKRQPRPRQELKPSALRMPFFASGTGTALMICGEPGQRLTT